MENCHDGHFILYFMLLLLQRVGLKKELPLVDHASCKFPPIKKNLYVQVRLNV